MNWDDVEDVIFNGTLEQINAIKCPDCGGDLKMSYYPSISCTEVQCRECGILVRSNGVNPAPNFAKNMA